MKRPFRLGFMTHLEGTGDPGRIYNETLELFITADRLGFDAGWIAQHHFHVHPGRLPSPFPFLAAVAQRTERLRLGTSIVSLPLEIPLRVAEDAAVVDLMSGGRVELGIGSGGAPEEFEAFGLDTDQRLPRTTEGVQVIRDALLGKALTDDGLHLDPPSPSLVDRLWQSSMSERGARYVAEQGAGMLLAKAAWRDEKPTDEVQELVVQAYKEAWAQNESLQDKPPRIGLSRGIYPAADKETALADLRPAVMDLAKKQERMGNVPAGKSLEYHCYRQHIAYGSPAEVAAFLAADRTLPHATDLILQFSPLIPTFDRAKELLAQIATEIAPALGWHPG